MSQFIIVTLGILGVLGCCLFCEILIEFECCDCFSISKNTFPDSVIEIPIKNPIENSIENPIENL